MAAPLLLLLVLAPQTNGGAPAPPATPSVAPASVAAARAPRSIVLDGRDDDDVWRVATPITAFREFQPREDGDPRYPTEARVAYDTHHFYVFVRAFDPAPDSILKLLARRDVRTPSDQLKIIIDSYHDRRSGYEFAVNPAGVKRDYSMYNDGDEDDAWDAVWDVATQVDSLGWTAEFRIPLSQLRYAPADTITFGFGVWRDIERHTERVSWPVYRRSQAGLVSQLGEVTGLVGLASPARLELMPYGVAKSVPLTPGVRETQVTAGADIKYGLTSNLTLDATVNPDFGQVEADPSVLNLSAFETFLQERRPFFVEGTGIFRFDVNCSVVNCNGEGLFYSRRVGRRPALRDDRDAASPIATTIIGAGKLTGRLPGGLSLGLLEAVTAREVGTSGSTIEPLTNFVVLRAQQDLRNGASGIGVIGTAVNRDLDDSTQGRLRRSAYVAAVDARHRFSHGRYEVATRLVASRVDGTPAAIAATQRSNVHLYQRPDAGLTFDPDRTSLTGDAEEFYVRKVGGGMLRFETSYQRRSPGFEINDLGFLLRADQQSWNTWSALQFQRPQLFFRQGFWNFNWWQYWTTAGLPTERAANTNAHFQLNNRWWVHTGGTLSRLGTTYCDNCARGGPAVRRDPALSAWGGIEGDSRFPVVPFLWFNFWRGDGGRSRFVDVSPSLDLRVASRFTTSFGVSLSRNRDDWQWVGNITDTVTRVTSHTFAHLEQQTASINWRLDYTLSPTLSVQVYASPFVTRGTYSDVRELAEPRAADYRDRFRTYGDTGVTNNPGGFNFKEFRSNLVVRWEYRPGSTLFVVWTQGRDDLEAAEGDRTLRGDFRRLFDAYPMNTFLVKLSYWLNR